MDQVKIFYDLETTGVDFRKHSIHQLSGLVEVNGCVVEEFDIRMAPHPLAKIEPEALAASGVTEQQILAYMPMQKAHLRFTNLLAKYINRYDKLDKAWLVGFNNRGFDDAFLRKLFELCGNNYFGSYFWSDSLDVMVLASQYLIERRRNMPSFKLKRVAEEVGIVVDESRLHDASYDVHLTREIYNIVTGLEIEI